jgi:ElaB/YqjD/DUF883 family membrane-anchored ribosome-binding protein
MESITAEEYNAVLRYYDIDATGMNSKQIKRQAEDILATKLCRCIKKVEKNVEEKTQAIAICTDSVISKKGFKISGYKCDKKKKVNNLSKRKQYTKKKNINNFSRRKRRRRRRHRRKQNTKKRKTNRLGKKGRKSRRAPGR